MKAHSTTRAATISVGLLTVTSLLAACTGGNTSDNGEITVTMWARSATEAYSAALVDAFNEQSEGVTVELTIIPNDNFDQRLGAAAGANQLPDLLSADVVLAPNYTSQGVYIDITDRIQALDFAGDLAQAHIVAASIDSARYAVPHKVDSSFMFYNKDLFAQAGLDPENPPLSYDDIYAAAEAIDALGDDVHGFYIGGNCGGCFAYTAFANGVAGGEQIVSDDGRTANLDNSAFAALFDLYKRMFDNGLMPESAKTEDGSTWQELFVQGKVGLWPNGSYSIPRLGADAQFEWGYAPLTDQTGTGTATFVGGDVLGITASSTRADAAWEFISWTLSEEAQVEIVAKSGDLPVRTDLADNRYTAEDPRVQAVAEGIASGYTPSTLVAGSGFNSPNGPWLAAVRGAVFGTDPASALRDGELAIQALMDESY